MKLTVETTRLSDGRWKAFIVEMPQIHYTAKTIEEVQTRIYRLVYALRSPNIRIEKIMDDGDVVLSLSHRMETEKNETNGLRHYTLTEAASAFN